MRRPPWISSLAQKRESPSAIRHAGLRRESLVCRPGPIWPGILQLGRCILGRNAGSLLSVRKIFESALSLGRFKLLCVASNFRFASR